MNAAHDLLQSLRDFGWPILAFAIFAPIPTYVFPTGRSREEKTAKLLFVGTIIAAIEVLFFSGDGEQQRCASCAAQSMVGRLRLDSASSGRRRRR